MAIRVTQCLNHKVIDSIPAKTIAYKAEHQNNTDSSLHLQCAKTSVQPQVSKVPSSHCILVLKFVL